MNAGQKPREPTTETGRVLLELLQAAGSQGMRISEIRDTGMRRPMPAIYDLQLTGWPVERTGDSVRLRVGPPPPAPPAPPRIRRVQREP